jgi:hypothetical protein
MYLELLRVRLGAGLVLGLLPSWLPCAEGKSHVCYPMERVPKK